MPTQLDDPVATIGLPVFNGENFVEDAIRSVLAQTLPDLELIISDNASIDRTPEICRDYAAMDNRIVYRRNPRNLGAAPNYNACFAVAQGRYFKWLAHDDRIMPRYLEATVATMEAAPDVVLCNTVVDYIDAGGEVIGRYDSVLGKADHPTAATRFSAMILESHSCVDFFGLVRRDAMQGSLLHASFHGADRAFLAQMALRGRLVQLREPLVQMREHPGRYTRSQMRAQDRLAWHDATRVGRINLPTCRLYAEYLAMVRNERLARRERARCAAALLNWWFCNWNAARVSVDLLSVAVPSAVGWAEQVKGRLFGMAPGHFVDGV